MHYLMVLVICFFRGYFQDLPDEKSSAAENARRPRVITTWVEGLQKMHEDFLTHPSSTPLLLQPPEAKTFFDGRFTDSLLAVSENRAKAKKCSVLISNAERLSADEQSP